MKKQKIISDINNRIAILDGLRLVAILMVMLFHYYNRFLGTHYSYSIQIPIFFKYGYLGVQLFFIISGFVILQTLTKCESFFEFIKKRLVRLIPGMIICSTLTFLVVSIFDTDNLFPNSKDTINLIVSNTFVSPSLVNSLNSVNVSYIDGAYWSLWVEITFYVFVGFFYFINPKKIIRNFSIFVFFGLSIHYLVNSNVGFNYIEIFFPKNFINFFKMSFEIFNFFVFGIWFLAGMVLKNLYFDKTNHLLLLFLSCLFILQNLLILDINVFCFTMLTYILLILFIYKPTMINFLGNKYFSTIGIASYSIYLLHQNIGVLIINKISNIFEDHNFFIGIFVILLFFLFGIYSFKFLEVPLGKKINLLIKKNNLKLNDDERISK